jgi:branched-chain amino acid transport system ATP-binding protein
MSAVSSPIAIGQLKLAKVEVRFGAVAAVNRVEVSIEPQRITGLIGPNGAGKTTLLNAISGFAPITDGRVHLDGTDMTAMSAAERARLGVVRGFQTVRLLEQETVFDNILVGCERAAQPGFFAQALNLPSQRWARERDRAAAWEIAVKLGLAPFIDRPVAELPFATRRLTEIARILVIRPKVLLLDEPAAGLDTRDRQHLTETLLKYHSTAPFTMMVIEHDVNLVRHMCSQCVALAQGAVVATGTPDAVLENDQVRRAYFGDEAGHA